jgi:3-hydroxyisobutyrate dehydrogenase-like beta-hydroxyacid dehydrogenase
VEQGARAGSGLGELGSASDAVFLALPGPAEVKPAARELVDAMAPGSLLISVSTVSPALIRELDEGARERGVALVDAPVSGAADGAQEGTLTIMVGAEPETLQRCLPLLEAIGRTIVHTGPVGTGSAAKLATNMLWFSSIVGLSQSLALGVKAGIEPRTLANLIPATAGSSWAANHDLLNIIRGDDDERFTLALCCKDLRLIVELADEVGAEVPLAALAQELFEAATERFGAHAGQLAVARLAEAAAGVSIRARAPVPGTAADSSTHAGTATRTGSSEEVSGS